MSTGQHLVMAGCLALLLVSAAEPVRCQSTDPTAEAIDKRIAELSSAGFKTRQNATQALEQIGSAALPALRKALTTGPDLDLKRRIEQLENRITASLLEKEARTWEKLTPEQCSIRARMERILDRNPQMTNAEAVTAIYLLALGREPTKRERTELENSLARETDTRRVAMFSGARRLMDASDFQPKLAKANLTILTEQKRMESRTSLENRHKYLEECGEVANQFVECAAGSVIGDGALTDVVYLMAANEFPSADARADIVRRLQRSEDRTNLAGSLVRVLILIRAREEGWI